jgi:plasmid stability protein
MKNDAVRQYTIRNIPNSLDAVLRQRARESKKSFNQVVLEALMAGADHTIRPKRDFSAIAGSLSSQEASELDDVIRQQRGVESELWT